MRRIFGPSRALLRVVERAIAQHASKYRQKTELQIVRAHIAALTPREREVFELIIHGKTNKYIAGALGCTERTIKAHRHRVMEKMQVQSLAELVSADERVAVFASAIGQPAQSINSFEPLLKAADVPHF